MRLSSRRLKTQNEERLQKYCPPLPCDFGGIRLLLGIERVVLSSPIPCAFHRSKREQLQSSLCSGHHLMHQTLMCSTVQAEFRAEQEYLQTLSFLGPEEQTKFKERQGVQFMYMKPPGMDAMAASAAPSTQVNIFLRSPSHSGDCVTS
jgi:hypothetical protein